MNELIQPVVQLLTRRGVPHALVEHAPVYTIEEMATLGLPDGDAVAKNLFIRDDKKRAYYIVVVRQDKTVNLKALRAILQSRPLIFASKADLWSYLKLTKGAVTPFGVLNDESRSVTVVVDKAFAGQTIAVHPNANTATVWLATDDLVAVLKEHGNPVVFADL